MYDNTKFEAAFIAWMAESVEIGFGEHYAGDLLDDFDRFCAENGLLKRSPGRVAFGKMLRLQGVFERRKRLGLTYWSGLKLLRPPKKDALEPKRYALTRAAQDELDRKRMEIKAQEEYETSGESEAARLAAFKAETERETRRNIEKVGQE